MEGVPGTRPAGRTAAGRGVTRLTQPKGDHSRGVRIAFLVAGHLCLALGVLGFVLPVLPGTVFLIAAAFLYARGSVRFYNWLHHHRWFGPPLRDWEQHRAMTVRAKVIAIAMLLVGVGLSIVFVAKAPWLRLVLAGTALAVTGLILMIKTRKQ
jgi:uncharacterized membrane protein YbaN (DUF454 family)